MSWSTFGQTYTVYTVAGNGTSGFSGDNLPATAAQLHGPYGVAVDSSGNLYIGDSGNNLVRKVANSINNGRTILAVQVLVVEIT